MKRFTRREFLSLLGTGFFLSRSNIVDTGSSRIRHPGRVVSIRRNTSNNLKGEEISKMLDKAISKLTGIENPHEAWLSLFNSQDHVSIKVNCLGGMMMSSNPHIALSLANKLISCGIRKRNILIWDRSTRELKESGYPVNIGGSDIQCFGTDQVGYTQRLFEHNSVGSLFSRIVTDFSSKIINLPVLKDHGICGLTFALKNHFGSINNPNKYHLNKCNPYIADLNKIPLLRKREVLIVGDATYIQVDGGPAYKNRWARRINTILMADDPVAIDRVALGILERERKILKRPPLESVDLYPDYIETAWKKGIGEAKNIEHIKINI